MPTVNCKFSDKIIKAKHEEKTTILRSTVNTIDKLLSVQRKCLIYYRSVVSIIHKTAVEKLTYI